MINCLSKKLQLNSFWSICYCVIILGIQAYTSYTNISRYKEAEARAWPGNNGTPGQVALVLVLTVLSLLLMPIFFLTSFFRTGNLANDGFKLGRDHALFSSENSFGQQECCVRNEKFQRLWKHFCPLSQTIHLIASFLLLLPGKILTAVEVNFGYTATDVCWRSELDFLFSPERAAMSDIKSTVNLSQYTNATHVLLPTPPVPAHGWGDHVTVSIAFANFCFALTAFLVRYASVFWYTNKSLTFIFSIQLLAMLLNGIFGYNGFSIIYCVGYNKKLYQNVRLGIHHDFIVVLYFFAGIVLLLSTTTFFEYGAHYFNEKFNLIEECHKSEEEDKPRKLTRNGCQGYIPHSCAMICLVIFSICKGPIVYDLVLLMRQTNDQLILSSIICDVCYMVFLVAFWFGLTLKQQWQFRILDYVPLEKSVYIMQDDVISKTIQFGGHGDGANQNSLTRMKHLSNIQELHSKQVLDQATVGVTNRDGSFNTDMGTDDSETANVSDIVKDIHGNIINDSSLSRRSRGSKRNGSQRVTFETSDDIHNESTSRRSSTHQPNQESSHVHVFADVHNIVNSDDIIDNQQNSELILRHKNEDSLYSPPLNKEYRNSVRSKCGEIYEAAADPLPTLMSSFRDKVRESSIAASNFKEKEKHFLGNYSYGDSQPGTAEIEREEYWQDSPSSQNEAANFHMNTGHHVGQRQGLPVSDCPNSMNSFTKQNKKVSDKVRYNASISSDEGHRSSYSNSITETSELSIPPLIEDVRYTNNDEITHSPTQTSVPNTYHRHATNRHNPPFFSRPVHVVMGKGVELKRRDSANYSLSSSQDASSNESEDHVQGLCSQV